MKSMTGFGKQRIVKDAYQVEVELKTVNHRFLDSQIKLSNEYNQLELPIRQAIKEKLARGRVECFVTVRQEQSGQKEIRVNWGLVDSLMTQLKQVEEKWGTTKIMATDQLLAGLAREQDFFEVLEKNTALEDVEETILEAVFLALEHLDASREKEGTQIKGVLQTYHDALLVTIKEIQGLADMFMAEHYERLSVKLAELLEGKIEESRLLTEVALLVDRADINEELERLVIHSQNLASLLEKEQAIGRELDFLIQEMNREVNTIGSKTSAIKIKELVVKLKVTLEKIREQIQNIE